MTDATWSKDPFGTLRKKWSEVPGGGDDRVSTPTLMKLSDAELVARWRDAVRASAVGEAYSIRGWYHALYKDVLRGKRVLDVGSGFGIDALTFAENGAKLTCCDIVDSNLDVLRRLAKALGVSVEFHYMDSLASLSRLGEFDVIWCQGSLINAPFNVIRDEVQVLLQHLPVGGRWIELAYPKIRWEREGRLPFEVWGSKTDGNAPWVEWYDLAKVKAALAPAEFDVILDIDFHNSDFNWFDLVRKK